MSFINKNFTYQQQQLQIYIKHEIYKYKILNIYDDSFVILIFFYYITFIHNT